MIALALRFWPYAVAAIAILGVVWWIFHKGELSERTANVFRVLVESEDSRKLRESNDAKARRLDDDAALLCLRDPSGCRK